MENVSIQRQPSTHVDLVDTLGSAKQKLEKFFATHTQRSYPQIEIATITGLNRNTVRRECQALLKAGKVKKDMNHRYAQASGNDETFASMPSNQQEPLKTTPASLNESMSQVAPTTTVSPPANEKHESTISKLATKLPKIEIDEILFVAQAVDLIEKAVRKVAGRVFLTDIYAKSCPACGAYDIDDHGPVKVN